MAVVLGLGDSFHLVPRALALCTTGLQDYTFALGMGKFIQKQAEDSDFNGDK